MTPDGARLLVADSHEGPSWGSTVQIVATPANTLSGAPIALNPQNSLGWAIDGAVTPRPADGAGTSLPATTLMTGRTFARHGSDSAHTTRSVVVATVQPGVALSGSSLDFGPVAVGTSAAKTLTLTNTGNGPLSISGSALTGAGEFTAGADSCTGQVVAAGATCTVTVSFHPSAEGARSARLAFTDDASGSPHAVALSGQGTTTGTVTGTVKDGSRAGTPPLPGALITLCQIVNLSNCTTATTGSAGGYRFANVRAGSYDVTINPPSGSTLGQGSRLADVAVAQTTDATTILRKDAPLPSGVRISSGTGSSAGGHPSLYWDSPFAIDVPPLKPPGAHGTPNSTVSTSVFVALRTAGSGQTVIGSALTYSVSYDASGAAVRAVATSSALPGVISAGFSLTLGDIAIPAGQVTLMGGSVPATATALRASSDGLRRLAHGALELTMYGDRSSGAATARAFKAAGPGCIDAQNRLDDAVRRMHQLSQELADLLKPDPDADAIFGTPSASEVAQLRALLEQARQEYADAKQGIVDNCADPNASIPCTTDSNIFDGDRCNPDGPVAIDPSGYVRTRGGVPIENARVVLQRSDTAKGPYVTLPNVDQRMAPNNRRNPDATDIDGHFGWDVFPGYYRVKATRKGCRGSDTTKGLRVPPPVTNLRLTLSCPNLHRAATRVKIVGVHRRGPSTVVAVQVSSRRKPTGMITLSAPGLGKVSGFVDARHPRATLVLAGHPGKRARLVARYAGNARWAPSRGRR